MSRNNKKDICEGRIDYSSIALLSKKLRVGIIGAGKGGLIKAKHFLKQNSQVFILTKDKISQEGIEKARAVSNRSKNRSHRVNRLYYPWNQGQGLENQAERQNPQRVYRADG